MVFSIQEFELLQVTGILPNPFYIYKYEVYDIGRYIIGFKVNDICLYLLEYQGFKVVEPCNLREKYKLKVLRMSGYRLFQTAIEAFRKSSESPAKNLVSKLHQNSSPLKIWSFLFWYNLCSLCRIRSSAAMLNSNKMSDHENFLDNFKEKCDLLWKANVIPEPFKRMRYNISYFITEWRHSGIVIHGEKHSFVLELSYDMFQKKIHNCPKIRYLPPNYDLNLEDVTTINDSANNLVNLAIDTVAAMPKYNLLNNNCQNFVKQFLTTRSTLYDKKYIKTEGEKICEILEYLDCKPLQIIIYILLEQLYIHYDQIPDVFLPATNSFIVVSILFLLLLITYHYLSRENNIFKDLMLLIVLISILYFYSKKSVNIFHGFFLMLWLFTIRLFRLKPRYIALNFFILALCLGFVTYEFLSKPFLGSVAIAVYIAGFGMWSIVGNTRDHDLTVVLPCVVVMICFRISNHPLVWIIIAIGYLIQLYGNQSFFESVLLVVTLLIRDFCVSNSGKNTHSTHLILVYIMFFYVLVETAYKYKHFLRRDSSTEIVM